MGKDFLDEFTVITRLAKRESFNRWWSKYFYDGIDIVDDRYY